MSILVTLRRRGHPVRRWVGIYPGTSDAIVATIELLEAEGATECGRINTEVLS